MLQFFVPLRVWEQRFAFLPTPGRIWAPSNSEGIALADLNGDGALDAFVANASNQGNRVYFGDGAGTFYRQWAEPWCLCERGGRARGPEWRTAFLDAVVGNKTGQANRVWFNNGAGNFTNSGQSLGSGNTEGIALADFNGDGSLDIFEVNNLCLQGNRIRLNDGSEILCRCRMESRLVQQQRCCCGRSEW